MKQQILSEEFLRMKLLAGIITENQYKEYILILEDKTIDEGFKNWLISGLIALTTLAGVGKVYQISQDEANDRKSQIEYYENILDPEIKKMDIGDLESLGMAINDKTNDLTLGRKYSKEELKTIFSRYAEKYMKNHPNEFAVGLDGNIYWTLDTTSN